MLNLGEREISKSFPRTIFDIVSANMIINHLDVLLIFKFLGILIMTKRLIILVAVSIY